ncbi:4Fe-4S dicluster domain-containing protein [Clostridium lacusfryxellense]|uniref:4Fe-4S dicluster domain-containing protein n=1 Tax=Clostridium lacusfryxellense TaxID=205328 RepID=UPI001C0AC308|nr:4Fe-4S dicluster domain-containing protein [Clostridium lacusfryxellense]MBU3109970.1 4Fe-4S dicluster domain-containing protein [Clostridium lacusfryxellense]
MELTTNSFVIADAKKCINCKVCELACAAAHNKNTCKTVGNLEIPIMPRLFVTQVGNINMPIQCHHCEDAPCAKVCLVGAIKNTDNKIVINEQECIGCKACAIACPFGAIELSTSYKSIANKCDLCNGNSKLACVEACPNKALSLVNLKELKENRNKKALLSLVNMGKEI